MDLYLNREKINIVRNVLNTSITQEETMEMIVPDALPDIRKIVCADAAVLVRSKDTDAGRVSITGVAAATVIYCPEGESGVRKVSADIPFTISAADGEITQSSRVTARLSIVSSDASIVNPRKFVVRANISCELACYNDASITAGGELEAGEDSGIELLKESRTVCVPVDVREKSFVIADELTLQNSSPEIGELLRTQVSLATDEAKVVGNKVVFRGSTYVSLLYNSMGEGELCGAELTSEFSQIMELENISEDCDFDIQLMLTGAYFETGGASDGRTVTAELHAVAQCVASEKKTIPYISDAYSTKYSVTYDAQELAFDNKDSAVKVDSVYRGTMDTEGDVSRVVSVSVSAGAVESAVGSGTLAMKVPLYVTCVYIDSSGQIMSAAGRYETETETGARDACNYIVTAQCGREVYATVSGGAIELRIPVDLTVSESSVINISPITEISCDEDSAIDSSKMPSLIISKTSKGDTIWHMAKRHHSTKALILSANGLESEEDITAGQMLIIPKKR